MAQIPQALQFLTSYLKEENNRIKVEDKQRRLNQAMVDVSNKFSELDPNTASLKGVRDTYLNSLKMLGQEDVTEAMPLVASLYQQALGERKMYQEESEDDALREGLSKVTGDTYDPRLSGQGSLAMDQVKRSRLENLQTTDEKGYEYVQKWQLQGETWQPFGPKVQTNKFGANERFSFELRGIKAREQFQQYAPQLTPYQTEVGGYPIFRVGTQLFFDAIDPDTKKITQTRYIAGGDYGGMVDIMSQGTNIDTRDFKKVTDAITTNAAALANLIIESGDPKNKNLYDNLIKGDIKNTAPETISALSNSTALLNDIASIEDATIRESAYAKLNTIQQNLPTYEAHIDKVTERSKRDAIQKAITKVGGVKNLTEYNELDKDMKQILQTQEGRDAVTKMLTTEYKQKQGKVPEWYAAPYYVSENSYDMVLTAEERVKILKLYKEYSK